MKIIEITLAYSTDITHSQARGTYGDFHASCHISGESEYVSLIPHSGLGSVNLSMPKDGDIEFNEYELILNIKNSHRKGDWHLNIPEINSKKLKKLTIKGFNDTGFQLSSLTIQNLPIEIIIKKGLFQEIAFSGNTNLSINGSTILNGSIRGTNVQELKIINSDLGKCYLFNLNIDKFLVQNCNINNIQISNVNIKTVITTGLEDPEIKELYRHLKYLFDQIGNKTEANKFFAKEMEYYMNSLSWRHDFGKKLVSSINMCVNDYGNNWWLPIIWMFLITYYAAFYKFCYLQESGTFWELFINSILPISDIGNFYSFLDLLYKLTWAFLVYQFIIALRRISQR